MKNKTTDELEKKVLNDWTPKGLIPAITELTRRAKFADEMEDALNKIANYKYTSMCDTGQFEIARNILTRLDESREE